MLHIRLTKRRKVAIALALGVLAVAPTAQAMGDIGQRPVTLVGTWQVTVDPGAPGGGDSWESMLAYTGSRQVMESTSGRAGVTEGLGAWKQTGPASFSITFVKYQFANGVFAGKAVVRETITVVDADTYRGSAVATITDAAGNTQAVVPSSTVGSRVRP